MSIIWMHGLGDTPAGWSDLEQNIPKLLEAADIELETPIVFKFPAAPKAPVTINKGAESNSWFDLVDFPCTPDSKDDVKGITASLKRIHALIDSVAETVEHSKIIVGGFSQGAALALQAVYTYPKKLAGCVCLSGWLQMRDQFPKAATAANKKTRCFWGHGFMDNVCSLVRDDRDFVPTHIASLVVTFCFDQ